MSSMTLIYLMLPHSPGQKVLTVNVLFNMLLLFLLMQVYIQVKETKSMKQILYLGWKVMSLIFRLLTAFLRTTTHQTKLMNALSFLSPFANKYKFNYINFQTLVQTSTVVALKITFKFWKKSHSSPEIRKYTPHFRHLKALLHSLFFASVERTWLLSLGFLALTLHTGQFWWQNHVYANKVKC